MRSFWEETEINKRSLLRHLLEGDKILWRESERSDPWIGYLPIKMNKAVSLLEYFKPGKPMKGGEEREWVIPLQDAFRRLKLKSTIEKQLKNEPRAETAYHNLKVWAVYAAFGGAGKPHKRGPISPLDALSRTALENKLRAYQLGYLERGLGAFTGEALKII